MRFVEKVLRWKTNQNCGNSQQVLLLTAKEKTEMNLEKRRKWELVAILEYFRYKEPFDLKDNKIKLIDKIENYLIDIQKNVKMEMNIHFNLKTFIDIIGDDILNIKTDTDMDIVIDNTCYNGYNAADRSKIRRIFAECAFPGVRAVPTAFRHENPLLSFDLNVISGMTFATLTGVLVFLETMKTGTLAASLRSGDNRYRVACRIRQHKQHAPLHPWIDVVI